MVLEYIKEELEKTCRGSVEKIAVDGVVSVIGLGYSLRFHKRKPLYNTILPGSIIYADSSSCNIRLGELCTTGLGMLRHLGFSTVIPALVHA